MFYRSNMMLTRAHLLITLFIVVLSCINTAHAERIKDIASIQGVRDNPLIGYGIVVGLDGTGDQTQQTPFTTQSLNSMLAQLGVTLPPGTSMQLKNVASVMVTANLPAFARPGQGIDVTVSSMGNAKSLRGGTLLMTPLKGVDGQTYAIAQGNLVVAGAGAAAGGSKVQINQLSVGRISNGATVERAVPTSLGQDGTLYLELNTADFGTAQLVVEAINRRFNGLAQSLDGRVIQVRSPMDPNERVAFLAQLQNIDVRPELAQARVIINARTGSVVMNQSVSLLPCAVSHGNLTVTISTDPQVSQPNPLSNGQTVVAPRSQIEIKQEAGGINLLRGGASLAEVVRALNSLGTLPQDLLAILQAMKAAGALRAELEII
jgi:flagellar P-ring protein FlgI